MLPIRLPLRRLSRRHADLLAGAVLAGFVVAVALAIALPALIVGGAPGWGSGAALGLTTAGGLARPCGVLMGRLVGPPG